MLCSALNNVQMKDSILTYSLVWAVTLTSAFAGGAGKENTNSVSAVYALFPNLQVYSVGNQKNEVGPNHQFTHWLTRCLRGEYTGFPVEISAPDRKKEVSGFQAVSTFVTTPNGGTIGRIIMNRVETPLKNDERATNQRFLDQWFLIFFELSNLMARSEFEKLDSSVVGNKLNKNEYTAASIKLELKNCQRAIANFEKIFGPLKRTLSRDRTIVDGWLDFDFNREHDISGPWWGDHAHHYGQRYELILRQGAGCD